VRMRTELLQARDVGAALVDEAVALDADVMLLGLPYRTRLGGDFAIGRTIPYVFQNAPCRVIVVREAVDEASAARRQEGSR
jgi:nucleotide-binding universal stress UspA family protein